MAIVGRKPKPEDQRRNPNPPRHDWTEVENRPFGDAPPLSGRWPARTRRWWSVISRMPHCILWDDADWQFAQDTALVAAAFHRGKMTQAVELRARERILGTTLDARRDLRIRYVEPVEEKERPSIAAIEHYRKALEG